MACVQEHEFEVNPYSRVHQEKLLRFRDEVFCIQKVLHDQLDLIRDFKNMSCVAKLDGSVRPGYNERILRDCISSTSERITNFDGMNARAMNIGTYVSLRPLQNSLLTFIKKTWTDTSLSFSRIFNVSKRTKTAKKPPSLFSQL